MAGYPNSQSNPGSATPVWVTGMIPTDLTYLGYQAVADLSAAVGLPSPPPGAKLALVQATGGGVRFQRGATPTGSAGMLIAENAQQIFTVPNTGLKFIQNTGDTSALNVEYYG